MNRDMYYLKFEMQYTPELNALLVGWEGGLKIAFILDFDDLW